MKKFLAISAILTLGGLTLAGCPKEAAQDAGSAAGNAAADAGAATKDAAAGAVAGAGAAIDSAKIKTAILADAGLKDAKVDVEVKDKTVMLKGSVKNNDLKKKAGELATSAAPGATIKNMLLVK